MFLIDIQPGQTFKHTFVVSNKKTVPSIYPESKIFQNMPDVFATGFLVAFLGASSDDLDDTSCT